MNSLGIIDFIQTYREEIKKFNEIKNKTDEKKKMIEDIITKIEESKLIKDEFILKILQNHEKSEYFSLSKFFSCIEKDI